MTPAEIEKERLRKQCNKISAKRSREKMKEREHLLHQSLSEMQRERLHLLDKIQNIEFENRTIKQQIQGILSELKEAGIHYTHNAVSELSCDTLAAFSDHILDNSHGIVSCCFELATTSDDNGIPEYLATNDYHEVNSGFISSVSSESCDWFY